MKLTARNQLAGTVTSVAEGAAIANVEVDVNGRASFDVDHASRPSWPSSAWPRARPSPRSSRPPT